MAHTDDDLTQQPNPDDEIDPATGLPKNQTPVGQSGVMKPAMPGGQPPIVTIDQGTGGPASAPGSAQIPTGTAATKIAQSNPYASAPNGNEGVIDALYAKYGITDGGRGSGFADRAYWLEHPSEILNGRLEHDLQGTGTDSPQGTPGSGAWQTSGQNQSQGHAQTFQQLLALATGHPLATTPPALNPMGAITGGDPASGDPTHYTGPDQPGITNPGTPAGAPGVGTGSDPAAQPAALTHTTPGPDTIDPAGVVPGVGTGSDPAAGTLTYDQMLAQANQHASANKNYGHALDDTAINALLQKFGGVKGASGTAAGLQPVLDYIDQYQGGAVSGAPTPGAPGVGSPPPNTASPDYSNATPKDFLSQYRDAMMKQLGRLQTPTDANDPAIKGAIDANRVGMERGLQDNTDALSQSLYAQNPALLNSGGFDTMKQKLREQTAGGEASFAGNAVMSQNALRQQMLSNLMNTGLGLGTLDQNDSHFNDQMGFNYAQLQQDQNFRAMLALLQGGGL